LRQALSRFGGGRIAVTVMDMPIKCPVAPLGLTKADLIDQVKDIITVGEFYDLAAGGQIIFT
jgi:hypothetical protein